MLWLGRRGDGSADGGTDKGVVELTRTWLEKRGHGRRGEGAATLLGVLARWRRCGSGREDVGVSASLRARQRRDSPDGPPPAGVSTLYLSLSPSSSPFVVAPT